MGGNMKYFRLISGINPLGIIYNNELSRVEQTRNMKKGRYKTMKERKLNNEGFSLIELIVVIAIMAILVGVMAPTVTKFIERANESNDIQALQTIYTAVYTSQMDPMVTNQADGTHDLKDIMSSAAAEGTFSKSCADIVGTDAASISFKSKIAGTNATGNNVKVHIDGNDVTVWVGTISVNKNGADTAFTVPTGW